MPDRDRSGGGELILFTINFLGGGDVPPAKRRTQYKALLNEQQTLLEGI